MAKRGRPTTAEQKAIGCEVEGGRVGNDVTYRRKVKG